MAGMPVSSDELRAIGQTVEPLAKQACTDKPAWHNGNGFGCSDYASRWCNGGDVRRNQSWAIGASFRNPERACCACGGGSCTLQVGVLGGSISYGAELEHFQTERYSAQLQARLEARSTAVVHNRAMPSTGAGYASFCIDQVLPENVHVVVVEYNFNDAYGHDKVSSADTDGADGGMPVVEPTGGSTHGAEVSMERLLRNLLSRASPPWLIAVLAVCNGWAACETIHKEVARHYATEGDLPWLDLT
jgi:hypothetical protein